MFVSGVGNVRWSKEHGNGRMAFQGIEHLLTLVSGLLYGVESGIFTYASKIPTALINRWLLL